MSLKIFSAGRHKGTVTTANLFEEFDILLSNEIPYLSEEISFSQILKIWSENVGFPLVSVTQNYFTQTIKVQHVRLRTSCFIFDSNKMILLAYF